MYFSMNTSSPMLVLLTPFPPPPSSSSTGILSSIPLPIVPPLVPSFLSATTPAHLKLSAPSSPTLVDALTLPATSPHRPPKYHSLQQIYQATIPQALSALTTVSPISKSTPSHTPSYPLPSCFTTTISLPSKHHSLADALCHLHWHHAMAQEFDTLLHNQT